MASHQELVDELHIIQDMTTKERLKYAEERRIQQLERWKEYEADLNSNNNYEENKPVKNNKVKFGDSITLLEAAARNDYDEVEELLKNNIDPNQCNQDGLTALHQACIDNFADIVELLLDNNANVNAVDSEYWTPLHAACTCGNIKIAQILVNRGADLLAVNADNNMPYDICEEDEALDLIEQAMAKQEISQEQINEARLSREKLIVDDVKEFIRKGGDINATNDMDATILHIAAANGYVDLTRLFLLHTNNVNPQDKDGWTPLHAAACWCQIEIIEILGFGHNADPTIKNSLGDLPSDVTDNEEVKAMLQKLVKTQKESKKKKMFPALQRINGKNSRTSGLREQSFKGRSRRDRKSVISAVEAKCESEFWQKGQETDMCVLDNATRVELPHDDSSELALDYLEREFCDLKTTETNDLKLPDAVHDANSKAVMLFNSDLFHDAGKDQKQACVVL